MNRRKFVRTVPVVAAGMTCATPLLAAKVTPTDVAADAKELLQTFQQQVSSSIIDTNGVTGSLRHLYTPATRPKMVAGQLHFNNQHGDRVILYRKNGHTFAKVG